MWLSLQEDGYTQTYESSGELIGFKTPASTLKCTSTADVQIQTHNVTVSRHIQTDVVTSQECGVQSYSTVSTGTDKMEVPDDATMDRKIQTDKKMCIDKGTVVDEKDLLKKKNIRIQTDFCKTDMATQEQIQAKVAESDTHDTGVEISTQTDLTAHKLSQQEHAHQHMKKRLLRMLKTLARQVNTVSGVMNDMKRDNVECPDEAKRELDSICQVLGTPASSTTRKSTTYVKNATEEDQFEFENLEAVNKKPRSASLVSGSGKYSGYGGARPKTQRRHV